MLESQRVAASYLVIMSGGSYLVSATLVVLVLVFGLTLVIPLIHQLTSHTVLLIAVVPIVLLQLAVQFSEAPYVRLFAAAGVLVLWGWIVVIILLSDTVSVSIGVPVGLAGDLAIRIAFRSVDLPWMPDIAKSAVSVLLAAVLLLFAVYGLAVTAPPRCSLRMPLALLVIGPCLAMYHFVTGNLGLVEVKLGISLLPAGLVLAAGTLGGLAVLVLLPWVLRPLLVRAFMAIATGAGLWIFWYGGELALPGLLVGTAGDIVVLGYVLSGSGRMNTEAKALSVAILLALSLVLEAALLLAFYGLSGSPVIILLSGLLSIFGLFVVSTSDIASLRMSVNMVSPCLVAICLLLIGIGKELLDWDVSRTSASAATPMTVMTYNIRSGFGLDNRWSLERTVQVIESEHPDVVVLEEASRGWTIATGSDEVLWLSRRLGMPFVFGPTSDDGLWGNAILSRLPIGKTKLIRYSEYSGRKRGAIGVQINLNSRSIWVFGTHLDAPQDAKSIRNAQVRELLVAWHGRTPALIAGDFNSDPDDHALQMLEVRGFNDLGRVLGPAAYTSHDRRRIDYILASPGVRGLSANIPQVWTSDHRPMVAVVQP